MNRAQERALAPYAEVFSAALTGGEDDIRAALAGLDERQVVRMRNTLIRLTEMTRERRAGAWAV